MSHIDTIWGVPYKGHHIQGHYDRVDMKERFWWLNPKTGKRVEVRSVRAAQMRITRWEKEHGSTQTAGS